jgi:hypothetical protein
LVGCEARVALLAEIIISLRRGDVGLDIVAALSMLAALVFVEYSLPSWSL